MESEAMIMCYAAVVDPTNEANLQDIGCFCGSRDHLRRNLKTWWVEGGEPRSGRRDLDHESSTVKNESIVLCHKIWEYLSQQSSANRQIFGVRKLTTYVFWLHLAAVSQRTKTWWIQSFFYYRFEYVSNLCYVIYVLRRFPDLAFFVFKWPQNGLWPYKILDRMGLRKKGDVSRVFTIYMLILIVLEVLLCWG
jgi:hypothetical protein